MEQQSKSGGTAPVPVEDYNYDEKTLDSEKEVNALGDKHVHHRIDGVTEADPEVAFLSEVPHEVRAVVPDTDNVDEPCETFRAYFLGTVCAVVGTGLNTCEPLTAGRQPSQRVELNKQGTARANPVCMSTLSWHSSSPIPSVSSWPEPCPAANSASLASHAPSTLVHGPSRSTRSSP